MSVGSDITLTDADSVNSNVTVSQVIISVESDLEFLFLLESDSDITQVGSCVLHNIGAVKLIPPPLSSCRLQVGSVRNLL